MKRWSARAIAWCAFVLGIAASVAANVAHAHPELGPRIAAGFAPVALLLTVEIMSRVPWPDGIWWRLGRYGGTGTVALVAAVMSYRHMYGLLETYGEDTLNAAIGPLAVDGLMIVASLALLALGQQPTTDQPVPVDTVAEQPATEQPNPVEQTTSSPDQPPAVVEQPPATGRGASSPVGFVEQPASAVVEQRPDPVPVDPAPSVDERLAALVEPAPILGEQVPAAAVSRPVVGSPGPVPLTAPVVRRINGVPLTGQVTR